MSLSTSQDDDGLESVYADRTDPSGGAGLGRTTPTQATPAHAISRFLEQDGQSAAAGSVVVDPISQVPSAAGQASRDSRPALRRQAEATLVLEGRRVDELRREIIRQQQKLKRKRGVHIVWWAVAGALAVLAGGWIASGGELGQRLLGTMQGGAQEELPEVSLDEVSTLPTGLQPTAHQPVLEDAGEGEANEPAEVEAAAVAPQPPSEAGRVEGSPDAEATGTRKEASSSGPKDWGDGFDQSRSGQKPAKAGQTKAASRAISLDDLEEERLAF